MSYLVFWSPRFHVSFRVVLLLAIGFSLMLLLTHSTCVSVICELAYECAWGGLLLRTCPAVLLLLPSCLCSLCEGRLLGTTMVVKPLDLQRRSVFWVEVEGACALSSLRTFSFPWTQEVFF